MKLFSKDSGVPISLLLTVGAFSVIVKLHRWFVSSSSVTCMAMEMLSRSLRISWRFFVPRMFLKDVWARSLNNKIVLQLVCSVCTINTIYTNNSRVRWSVLQLSTFYLGLQYVKWVLKTILLLLIGRSRVSKSRVHSIRRSQSCVVVVFSTTVQLGQCRAKSIIDSA